MRSFNNLLPLLKTFLTLWALLGRRKGNSVIKISVWSLIASDGTQQIKDLWMKEIIINNINSLIYIIISHDMWAALMMFWSFRLWIIIWRLTLTIDSGKGTNKTKLKQIARCRKKRITRAELLERKYPGLGCNYKIH